jgi:hypothetical protein
MDQQFDFSTYAGGIEVFVKLMIVFLDYVHQEFRMKTCWCRRSKGEEGRDVGVVELSKKGDRRGQESDLRVRGLCWTELSRKAPGRWGCDKDCSRSRWMVWCAQGVVSASNERGWVWDEV